MPSSSKSSGAGSGSGGAGSSSSAVGKKRAPLRRGLVEEVAEGPLRKKRSKEPSNASTARGQDDFDSDIDEEAELDDAEYDMTESQGAAAAASKHASKVSFSTTTSTTTSKAKDAKLDAQARKQRSDIHAESMRAKAVKDEDFEGSEDEDFDDDIEEGDEFGDADDLVEVRDGEYVTGAVEMDEDEEAIVDRFLNPTGTAAAGASGSSSSGMFGGGGGSRNLADIILAKIREKEEAMLAGGGGGSGGMGGGAAGEGEYGDEDANLSPKVVEVYTSVGDLLKRYRAGKLPKALKMLPHLKNWEAVLWLSKPYEWSPAAVFAATRVFASNLHAKMAQRFYSLVLLPAVRDDIQSNRKLNYHLYMALKKALFKPAAFYKGILLPLAAQRPSIREAAIVSSAVAKVSVPAIHSAAALLKLAEMPYSGTTSLFIRVLLAKKYALPKRAIEALVTHFYSFIDDARDMPVIWHQSLLVFAQRYKLELDDVQRGKLRDLIRVKQHHQITTEVRRELFAKENAATVAANTAAAAVVLGQKSHLSSTTAAAGAASSSTTTTGWMGMPLRQAAAAPSVFNEPNALL